MEFKYTIKIAGKYINQDSSVVEIGCGTGCYGIYFSDMCKEYIGIDLSPEQISAFNNKIKNRQLKKGKGIISGGKNE